jgi:hypothetical protein
MFLLFIVFILIWTSIGYKLLGDENEIKNTDIDP